MIDTVCGRWDDETLSLVESGKADMWIALKIHVSTLMAFLRNLCV